MRGKFRSRTIESLVREAQQLQQQGVKELCLVAQDTTRYGQDLGIEQGLTQLVKALLAEHRLSVDPFPLRVSRLARLVALRADGTREAFRVVLRHPAAARLGERAEDDAPSRLAGGLSRDGDAHARARARHVAAHDVHHRPSRRDAEGLRRAVRLRGVGAVRSDGRVRLLAGGIHAGVEDGGPAVAQDRRAAPREADGAAAEDLALAQRGEGRPDVRRDHHRRLRRDRASARRPPDRSGAGDRRPPADQRRHRSSAADLPAFARVEISDAHPYDLVGAVVDVARS